jgi:hypothetical protein
MREPLLPHSKPSLGFLEKTGVAYPDIIRGGEKWITAHIDAHRLTGRGQRLIRHIVTGEDDKPFVSRAASDSDSLNITLSRTREVELKCAYIANSEIFTIKLPAALCKGEGIVAVPAFEAGEPSLTIVFFNSAKERLIGFIQALNDILEALRTHALVFRESIFEAGQFLHLGIFGDRLVVMPVGSDALFKGCVVKVPAEVKPNGSVLESLTVRFNAIFEGLFHCPVPSFNVAQRREGVKPYRASLSVSPAFKSGVLDGQII